MKNILQIYLRFSFEMTLRKDKIPSSRCSLHPKSIATTWYYASNLVKYKSLAIGPYLLSFPNIHLTIMFPFPAILGSVELKVLVSREEIILLGERASLRNFKLWLLPVHFRIFMPRDQQSRKRVSIPARAIYSHWEKVGLVFHNGGKGDIDLQIIY